KGRSGLVGEVCRPAEDPETPDGNYQQDPFEHVAHRILCGPIDPICFQRHALALPLSSRLSRRLLIRSTRLRRDACSVETRPVSPTTTVAIRAGHSNRRSMASNTGSRFGPTSPCRIAGSTTMVTIATPPIQKTTARTCNARAITTSYMTQLAWVHRPTRVSLN